LNLEEIIHKFDSRRIENDRKGASFRVYLKTLLEDYKEAITNADLMQDIDPVSAVFVRPFANKIKKQITELTEEIINALDYFLLESCIDGKAFEIFNMAIENLGVTSLPKTTIPRQNTSYRLRPIDSKDFGYTFARKELFHIPFNKRGLISTNRYSLSGYPCLYLANATYVAWREITNNDGVNELYAGARFENTNRLRLLTLDSQPFSERTDKYGADIVFKNTELFDYAGFFPLLAACSFKIYEQERNYKFKPEYIIPQFLLEYARKSPVLEGIAYRSTRTESNIEAWNYVIPPMQIGDNDYCPTLMGLFRVSDTHNFNFIEPHKLDPKEKKKANAYMKEVKLSGSSFVYEETFFSQAEYILDQKDMGSIL
jgi:RES domain